MSRAGADDDALTIEGFVGRHREWVERYAAECKASSETVQRLLDWAKSGDRP